MTEKPTLFLEFHGHTDDDVKQQTKLVGEIISNFKGKGFLWSNSAKENARLWTARHNAYYAIVSEKKGCRINFSPTNGFSTDVCVSISRLAEIITETKKDIDTSGLVGAIVGHVGDGNFHCIFSVNENDRSEMKKVWELSDRLIMRALSIGGTCTGEHGIGIGKKEYLKKEIGLIGLKTMSVIKQALDPNGIMNPGKLPPQTISISSIVIQFSTNLPRFPFFHRSDL
ncbi:unnamed protein product [Dracunculus medinensis]|uniref:D-lactate dehydrogenase (cytochrome) n=1 Tax=Dracunculus medinensis TaxID=318479 RepID=A0A3P7PIG3_DRAME|nr:unnamed protein product [Dracunculus medinensis]